jgi:hypothetical protein
MSGFDLRDPLIELLVVLLLEIRPVPANIRSGVTVSRNDNVVFAHGSVL